MAHRITDECTGCESCLNECPNEAIVKEGDKCVILPDKCTDCGICEDVCPVGAIVAEEEGE